MRSYVQRAEGSIEADRESLRDSVRAMLRRIEAERDEAIHDCAARFDRWSGAEYRVSPDRIRAAAANLSETFKEDFEFCLCQRHGGFPR
ncbi:MAG TPA: histidinol dehydrogenase [Xanthobacteraceae bacterium]|nr:histidinol dehydrogenase [Xanthobacteraceae bacterium]